MQNLYESCYHLDQRCYQEYSLTEDILMEHASLGMANYIKANFPQGSTVLIVAGVGNNGADGIALARLLFGYYQVKLFLPFGVKSNMAKNQYKRVQQLGIETIDTLIESDIIVDALFGAGLSRKLDSATEDIIQKINHLKGFKIACDIPSGISQKGNPLPLAFQADITITMGAMKESLYTDNAKEFVGNIFCIDLGVARSLYEIPTQTYLLDIQDLKLPSRIAHTTHKGYFGHLAVFSGNKEGASILCAMASLRFGVGLVTIVGEPSSHLPYSIMQDSKLPYNTTAIAFGMGFGTEYDNYRVQSILNSDLPIILDADIFYTTLIKDFLQQTQRSIVLTPHPKEFISLWKILFDEELDITTLQANRLQFVRQFCSHYPKITLILKGSNSIIAQDKKCFINPHGSARLSKGGSGDVLSGLVGALLAQGYSSIDSAIHASLALTLATKQYQGSSYSMLPTDLIKEVEKLEKNSSPI